MPNVDAKVWGKSMWDSMYAVAYGYEPGNEAAKQHIVTWFGLLRYTMPCEVCREHYTQQWTKFPIDNYLASNDKLAEWVNLVENDTNTRIGKPLRPLTASVKARYLPQQTAPDQKGVRRVRAPRVVPAAARPVAPGGGVVTRSVRGVSVLAAPPVKPPAATPRAAAIPSTAGRAVTPATARPVTPRATTTLSVPKQPLPRKKCNCGR